MGTMLGYLFVIMAIGSIPSLIFIVATRLLKKRRQFKSRYLGFLDPTTGGTSLFPWLRGFVSALSW